LPDAWKRVGGYGETVEGCRSDERHRDISFAAIAMAKRLMFKSSHARPPFLNFSGGHGGADDIPVLYR
jgi:hypothetical protein